MRCLLEYLGKELIQLEFAQNMSILSLIWWLSD